MRTFVVGVGMTAFQRPSSDGPSYPALVAQAVEDALRDGGIRYTDVEQVTAGYVCGDSTSGQRAVYEVGLSGVPFLNVNNNCASGSSALFLSHQLVSGGLLDCALAVGFDTMPTGPIGPVFGQSAPPLGRHVATAEKLAGSPSVDPLPAWLFAQAAREHMERYGTTPEQLARVAVKNRAHAVANPRAQFQQPCTVDDVLDSPSVMAPLTRLQCCPTSDGAAAAVVVSERFVSENDLGDRAVEIVGSALSTDTSTTFDSGSQADVVGTDLTRRAAALAYERAGLGPTDVDVIELHDCFTVNELLGYEALGLCGPGEAGALLDAGATTYGGSWVVNPSGGLLSKGHPLGATGVAQCAELVWQLRGEADARQVAGAGVGLQQNAGLGGACAVLLYRAPGT